MMLSRLRGEALLFGICALGVNPMKVSWGMVVALALLAFSTVGLSYTLRLRLNQLKDERAVSSKHLTPEQWEAEQASWRVEHSR